MKRLSAALILALLFSSLCFAQVQTGNASYNSSKTGHTISHPSLSFNTRVKVTNLRNNISAEAVVNGRVDISPDRIADISRDIGDALQMAKTGMTMVQIEVIHPVAAAPAQSAPAQPAAVQPVPVQAAPAQQSAPTQSAPAAQQPASRPAAAAQAPRTSPPASQTAAPVAAPVPVPVEEPVQPVPVETITEISYIPVS
ncbi:MAG: septal ring lytic transglycosylase RlpA family protein, partial [Treponema sp.]|nr:septal ring lytic transglycosylase RlpA family protein [Treponema sp.]